PWVLPEQDPPAVRLDAHCIYAPPVRHLSRRVLLPLALQPGGPFVEQVSHRLAPAAGGSERSGARAQTHTHQRIAISRGFHDLAEQLVRAAAIRGDGDLVDLIPIR